MSNFYFSWGILGKGHAYELWRKYSGKFIKKCTSEKENPWGDEDEAKKITAWVCFYSKIYRVPTLLMGNMSIDVKVTLDPQFR